MQIEGMTPQPLRQSAEVTPEKAREEAKLKEACQQFEEMYLNQMLSQMNKVSKSAGGGQEQEMYNGMLNQERAKAWAKEGGIGLANLLFQQMKQTL